MLKYAFILNQNDTASARVFIDGRWKVTSLPKAKKVIDAGEGINNTQEFIEENREKYPWREFQV